MKYKYISNLIQIYSVTSCVIENLKLIYQYGNDSYFEEINRKTMS